MKTVFKRALAVLLALAMCAGFAGCYSEEKTWAAKAGDVTMPIGAYIYYLTSAYVEAAGQVDGGTEVAKAQIEGKNGQKWIEERAMAHLKNYFYVNKRFDELGLEYTAEDQESQQATANMMWTYNKSMLENLGVAQTSFELAFGEYNVKLGKLMQAVYGEGGELALSADEMHSYYTENFTYYKSFYVNLSETDEEGNTTDFEEEKKAEVKEALEDCVKSINSGDSEFGIAEANFSNTTGVETTYNEPSAILTENLSSLFADALKDLKNGESALVDGTSRMYVVQKLDGEEDFEELMKDETRRGQLVSTMKSEEFADYVEEQAAGVEVEINRKAIDSVKLGTVADAMGKNGTSSAASEAESSGGEESSSEASSDASSQEESSEESSSETEE